MATPQYVATLTHELALSVLNIVLALQVFWKSAYRKLETARVEVLKAVAYSTSFVLNQQCHSA